MGVRIGEGVGQRVRNEARFAGIMSLIGVGVLLGLYDRAREGLGRSVKRWSGRGRITH